MPHAPSTFEHLMLPHLDAAFNLARWLLRDERDAEDAVQDAFIRAHRAFERFRGGDGRAWLLCIVRNVCYSQLRKKSPHTRDRAVRRGNSRRPRRGRREQCRVLA